MSNRSDGYPQNDSTTVWYGLKKFTVINENDICDVYLKI